MSDDKYARYGAAAGILSVILLFVGFGIFGSGIPKLDAPAGDWATFYSDHADRVQFGLTLVGIGLFFYVWFLGTLRSALAAAEGGTGRLASIAFGGGLIAGGFVLVAMAAALAASFRAGSVDPTLTQALNDLSVLVAAPAAAPFTALFAATAIVGYRYRPVPAAVAGFSALAAIGQPFAFATAFTDSGPFAGDGALGLFVPFATFAIAILTLSVALYRRPVPAAAKAQ
jgi:hypothetical protein